MFRPNWTIPASQPLANDAYQNSEDALIDVPGNRYYELTNHLGNVLATVNDVAPYLPGQSGNTGSGLQANIVNATDYYPFGMEMPGRTYLASGSLNYRYGFNGKENDNEVEGVGNSIDYGMRVYDPRVGRFMSTDPLERKYPWYTPYQYAGNNPIKFIDEDGEEPASPGTSEGQVGTDKTYFGTGPGGYAQITRTWYWHNGSVDYGTKADWYNEEDYQKVLTPIGKDLAGYEGLFSLAANGQNTRNWTPDQKPALANTKLGRFIGNGLSDGAANNLAASAQNFANARNSYVNGTTAPSSFNVEDIIGLTALLKTGLEGIAGKIAGSAQMTGTLGHAFTSKLIALRYALNPDVEKVTLDLGYKKLLGGGSFKWGPRPDVGVLFKNGDVKVFEVMSKTDVESKLFDKNFLFMKRNSISGNVIVMKPFSLKAVYK